MNFKLRLLTAREIKAYFAFALPAFVGACAPTTSENILFKSEPLEARENLSEIKHSGGFVLYYDREARVLYGLVENSELGQISVSDTRSVDVQSLKDMQTFFVYVGDKASRDECDTSITLTTDADPDAFSSIFGDVLQHFRMLGYPLTGASYMEIDGGYDIELTYFAECGYLENDAEKFALELNPTQ